MKNGKKLRTVRSKAPLRLGFGGGGTDVSPFCDEYGGYVLNATINKYSYCTIKEQTNQQNRTFFEATDIEEYDSCDSSFNCNNNSCFLLKGVYRSLLERGLVHYESIRISTYSDVQGGSGLGSSSTMVVAILQAFVEYFNIPLGEYELASLAWEIERKELLLEGGKQDQFCASFGGWNFMEFYDNRTIVNPLRIKEDFLNELSASLLICFVGKSRDSGDVIKEQIKQQGKSKDSLLSLKDNAIKMKEAVLRGSIEEFGNILNNSWVEKKKTSHSISNDYVDSVYGVAMDNGAFSGKLSGAGSSGFMMFLVKPEKKMQVKNALRGLGLNPEDVQFSKKGAISWEPR
jgi:D-glycero-alpha-D-manno-heptose-7-phosphate kinase